MNIHTQLKNHLVEECNLDVDYAEKQAGIILNFFNSKYRDIQKYEQLLSYVSKIAEVENSVNTHIVHAYMGVVPELSLKKYGGTSPLLAKWMLDCRLNSQRHEIRWKEHYINKWKKRALEAEERLKNEN